MKTINNNKKNLNMKNFILTFALTILVGFGATAQNAKGDWYVGTSDVANVAWTQWAMSPTLGYGVSDKLMVGLGIAQADSSEDVAMDLHARYGMNMGGQEIQAHQEHRINEIVPLLSSLDNS